MKFNSFIESLREKGDSQFTDNQLSTDVICIDQISHPINNDRRELFYKYAEVKEVIQKYVLYLLKLYLRQRKDFLL